ncbi:tRNA pseudouridine(55) synthase TruB [Taibaiella sp. KBW10]|uniref:tRNA pseudouridine(55) synthase TruB n=1 Tax=Taibaiella sp. KBW10 TaxID=2153357 RepID=UPI000F5AA396|nr:tRNA pseudouridine(55) synthase TruB [Taibaiella sp. KBW10]RQO30769.1 tRNA pseudouridine(55) synthase TruB [Taibaiella sp. KBW10]
MNQNLTEEEIKAGAVVLIDKAYRWTSFDAISKFRRATHAKIGHCGTLDPLATGLLICCTGKMTKQIEQFQKQDKEYTGIIHLGAITPTYDLESTPENMVSVSALTEAQILEAVKPFTGTIQQVPPAHSAIRKDGKRLYELARAGQEVVIEPRTVTIREFEITKIELPEVHFRVLCSTGTYIRSLAHDFGKTLGVGGYLQALRRTKIGDCSVDEARNIDEWLEYLQPMTFVKTPKQRPVNRKKKNFEE